MRVAVIGIGSNSVRMLVADVQGGRMAQVLRDREGTRLFGGLDKERNLTPESMLKTIDAIHAMQQKALAIQAQAVHLFATSAVRDAGNQQEFSRLIRERTGMGLDICSGGKEAALSFLGATCGDRCGVIDIGGGSTEYVIGKGIEIECGVSLQMGAVRLFQRYPVQSARDVPQLLNAAGQILREGKQPLMDAGLPDKWVGVGGTLTALAAVSKGVPWTDKEALSGCRLARGQVEEWLYRMADMTLAQRLSLPGIHPQRADIMVHGTAILAASMAGLAMEGISASELGNLDGYLKEKYLLPAAQLG